MTTAEIIIGYPIADEISYSWDAKQAEAVPSLISSFVVYRILQVRVLVSKMVQSQEEQKKEDSRTEETRQTEGALAI